MQKIEPCYILVTLIVDYEGYIPIKMIYEFIIIMYTELYDIAEVDVDKSNECSCNTRWLI